MAEKPGQCPFLKQECIRDRCSLWGRVDLARPGPLAGSKQTTTAVGCALNLMVFLLATKPPVMINPPPRSPFTPS